MANVTLRDIVKSIINKSKPNNVRYRVLSLSKLVRALGKPKVERVVTHYPEYGDEDPYDYYKPAKMEVNAAGLVFSHQRPAHAMIGEVPYGDDRKVDFETRYCKAISFKLINSKTLNVTLIYNSMRFNDTDSDLLMDKATFRLTFKGPARANINKSSFGKYPLVFNGSGNSSKKSTMRRAGIDPDFIDFDPGYPENGFRGF